MRIEMGTLHVVHVIAHNLNGKTSTCMSILPYTNCEIKHFLNSVKIVSMLVLTPWYVLLLHGCAVCPHEMRFDPTILYVSQHYMHHALPVLFSVVTIAHFMYSDISVWFN